MKPVIRIKGETAIYGLRGDSANTGALWEKFDRHFSKKPFDKIGEEAYEIRTIKGAKPGADVLVGYEWDNAYAARGWNFSVLPAGEYAVFDVLVANGYDSEYAAMEQWLEKNKERYIKRGDFIVERYVPEKFKGGDKLDSIVEIWLPVSCVSESVIPDLLKDASFDYITPENRDFIAAFDREMYKRGYNAGNTIGSSRGYGWRYYELIYSKKGGNHGKVYARLLLHDPAGLVLRLYFDNIDKHTAYIENASPAIKEIFASEEGICTRCGGKKPEDFQCKIRKSYVLEGKKIEKCSCAAYMFTPPSLEMLTDYMALFDEFYPAKKKQ
ncbi:MAG: GyrI-like domain-containing protein [Lachnospiraceae bacterium]|jgi:predicted transcriptional regulator YdeE|nr:GyrI-like domain-containing protein [Lachnospiraceae bacterium]